MSPTRRTHSVERLTRRLSSAQKGLLAIAAILSVLYGGITFIVDHEIEKLERARQKIGRKEYTAFKDETKRTLEKLDDRLDELEKKR